MITYEWRGAFGNAEVNALHAEGFGHRLPADDWQAQTGRHSLGCEWLHVDFDNDLGPFYFAGCGFRPTSAGLIALRSPQLTPRQCAVQPPSAGR